MPFFRGSVAGLVILIGVGFFCRHATLATID